MIIDNFTGTNGDDLSKEWWYDAAGDSGTGSTVIDNNEAQMTISSGNKGNHYKTLNRIIKGDFEIEFDFITVSGQAADSQQGGVYISPNRDDNSLEWCFVGLQYPSDDTPYVYFRYDDAGSNDSADAIDISSKSNPFSDKFRIKRVGNQVSGYYKNEEDASWSQIGSAHTWIEDDVYVGFMTFRNTIEAIPLVYTFDNFAINNCDVIVPWNISQTGEVSAQNVWNDDYKCVYHFSQDPAGGQYCVLDSTQYKIEGTPEGSMTSEDLIDDTYGIYGKTYDLDGIDDRIKLDVDPFTSGDPTEVTFEVIFKFKDTNSEYRIVGYNEDGMYFYIQGNKNSANNIRMGGYSGGAVEFDTNAYNLLNHHHLALTAKENGNIIGYVDGSAYNSASIGPFSTVAGFGRRIGSSRNAASNFANMYVSEFRFSDIQRSTAWIKASNVSLKNTLLIEGSSSSSSKSSSSSSSTTPPLYYTIDSSKIDGNLTNFPIGINVSGTGFISSKPTSGWQNLHVTVSGGNTELYTEVDFWEPSNDRAVIWTKIPFIPPASDTVLKLEYGSNNNIKTISSPEVYDDFSGENGDDPLKALWTKTVDLGTDYLSIQDNTLEFHSSGDSSNHKNSLLSNFVIFGDFDIQIDVALLVEGIPSTGTGYSADIRVYKDSNPTFSGIMAAIGTILTPSLPEKRFRAVGADLSAQYVTRDSSPTKLRIVRNGSQTKVYYWKNDQWEWDGNTNGIVVSSSITEAMRVYFYFEQEPNGEIHSQLDNFQINYCDQVDGFIGEIGDVPAQAVWKNSYLAVYHMNQDLSGGGASLLDSTVNGNDATPNANFAGSDLILTEYGYAIQFNGTDQYILLPDIFGGSISDITIEVFLKANSNSTTYRIIGWDEDGAYLSLRLNEGGNDKVRFYANSSTNIGDVTKTAPDITDYTYISFFAGENNIVRGIINDSIHSDDTVDLFEAIGDFNQRVLGAARNGTYPFGGEIVEVRISNAIAGSGNVVQKPTYYSLKNTLLIEGSSSSSSTSSSSKSSSSSTTPPLYYTIDSSKIDGNLTNFPVGINVSGTEFISSKSTSGWQNLHVTVSGGNTELYTEVDIWEPSNDRAVLWTKVPFIPSGNDTVLKLEYGSNNYLISITSETIYDSFEGDNGSDLSRALWEKTIQAGSDYLTIQNNSLEFSTPGDNANHVNKYFSNFNISGDFDFKLKVNVTTFDAPLGSVSYGPLIRCHNAGDNSVLAGIAIARGTGSRVYQATGADISATSYIASNAVNSLRIKRVSGVMTVYVFDNGHWEWNGDTDGKVVASGAVEDIYVELYFEQENGGAIDVSVENFTIYSCDQIEGYIGNIGEIQAQNVWDNSFGDVFHFSDSDPSIGSGALTNSTSIGNDGTSHNMVLGDSVRNGDDIGWNFDTNKYVNVTSSIYDKPQNEYTVEAFFKQNSLANSQEVASFALGDSKIEFAMRLDDGYVDGGIANLTKRYFVNDVGALMIVGTKYYMSMKISVDQDIAKIIRDVNELYNAVPTSEARPTSTTDVQIGRDKRDIDYFNGVLYELRISNTYRSDAWNKTTYYSLKNILLIEGSSSSSSSSLSSSSQSIA